MEIQVFPLVSIASCPVTSLMSTLISTLPVRSLYSCWRPTQPSSPPGSTVPALSASLYLTDDPVPSSPWWPCTDLSQVTTCLSCTGKPSTEYPRCVSPVLSRAEQSPTSSCWQHFSQWGPRYCQPSLPHRHTAGFVHILTPTSFSAELLSTCLKVASPHAWGYYSTVPELRSSFF